MGRSVDPGISRPGRGLRHRTAVAAKEAIALAAVKLGGVDRLVEWAKEDPGNEKIFWAQLYGKLVPLDLKAKADVTLRHVERRIIDSRD